MTPLKVIGIVAQLFFVILVYSAGIFGFELLFNNGVHFEAIDDLPGFYFLCVEVPRWVVPSLQLLVLLANVLVLNWLDFSTLIGKNRWIKLLCFLLILGYLLAEIAFLYTTPVYRNMFPYNFMESCNGTGFKTAFWDQQKIFYYLLTYGSLLPLALIKVLRSKNI